MVSCTDDVDNEINYSQRLDRSLINQLKQVADDQSLSFFKFPSEEKLAEIPQDPNNPLTKEKVELGKLLFHETGFARKAKYSEGMYSYSCASCHHADAGFQAGIKQGIGDGGVGFGHLGEGRRMNPNYSVDSLDIQPVRTPSAMNTAYQEAMLWNGQFGGTDINRGTEMSWMDGMPTAMNHMGYEGVETQAMAGLGVHRIDINREHIIELGYQNYFDAALPDLPEEERYSHVGAGLAIAAYERTLLATKAPFQRWLKGDVAAMDDKMKEGALLFFDKAECVHCHTGPALNSMEFYAIGMKDLEGMNIFHQSGTDMEMIGMGRGNFTSKVEDYFAFKVPQLYNLKDSPFYGHGGSFTSIKEVILYKNVAKAENAMISESDLAEEFVPLQLTDEEVDQLTHFITEGLYDPDLSRYKPEKLMSGYCFPNNDEISKADLGCQ